MFPADDVAEHEKVLLGFSPMENGEALDAGEHYNYMEYVLEVDGKFYNSAVAIVGDNESTNKAFVSRKEPNFAGYHNLRFDSLAKDILSDHDDVINKVQKVVEILSF